MHNKDDSAFGRRINGFEMLWQGTITIVFMKKLADLLPKTHIC
jgi:hypothetical protein